MTTDRISRRSLLGSVGAVSLAPALHSRSNRDMDHEQPAGLPPRAIPSFSVQLDTGQANPAGNPGSWTCEVRAGQVSGAQLQGEVQSGCIDYTTDPAGRIARIDTYLVVRTPAGAQVELRDRAERTAEGRHQFCTRCELSHGGAQHPALLIGRLDAGALSGGRLSLSVFEVS